MKYDFKSALLEHKQLIDADIEAYCGQVAEQTLQTYGPASLLVSEAYTDILKRGGKRIRGALTLVGYEMCGGKDRAMIIQAARAVEMMHAYILIIDDIQDRALLRRGGPSAHKLLETVHKKQKWNGDAAHTGISLGLNAALLGAHGAEIVLANLDVDEALRLKALNIMNHTMAVTAHGQTHDIINEISPAEVTLDDIENVLQWKTAHYSILNPIHMGMVLAGAPCEDTNAITEYALHAGKAFQITDDLLVVSDNAKSGKSAIDDIREGKQTLLTHYIFKHSNPSEIELLKSCLGKVDLSEVEFQKCVDLLIKSGAVEHSNKIAKQHVDEALRSLHKHANRWTPSSVNFLDNLAQYILARSA